MLVEFEQNHMVQIIQNFELFDKKMLTIFDKVLSALWETFLWLEQLLDAKLSMLIIFQCSKNYGSPTCVTRLKVAPNMADPISLNNEKTLALKQMLYPPRAFYPSSNRGCCNPLDFPGCSKKHKESDLEHLSIVIIFYILCCHFDEKKYLGYHLTILPGGRVGLQRQRVEVVKPGNIRNHYFEKYLHSMVLNLTVYVRNAISFLSKEKTMKFRYLETFLVKKSIWPIFHCKSVIWENRQ